MFEITAFVNATSRRNRPSTKWTILLKQYSATPMGRMVYELFEGKKADGAEVFLVRATEVTGAGGRDAGTETFADKFDALDRFNAVAGNVVTLTGAEG